MMESKDSNEQTELVYEEWHLNKTLLRILGILAPTVLLALIVGHSGNFLDFVLNTDHSKSKVPPHFFRRMLSIFFLWPFYDPENNKLQCKGALYNPKQVWKDGSILCTVVNMAVPGACKDPRQHWKKPPDHGIKLVMEYFDIEPVFAPEELSENPLTSSQENKFSKYLYKVSSAITRHLEPYKNMRFSTDYVARGMGLVIGEQNRKSTFYIYPIPKQNHQPSELEITIKGPYGNNGRITIPSILHYQQKWQPSTEYKRAMYMSSKLNNISPTTQGTSFLRRLSLKPQQPNTEIDIRVKITPTRAKISYIPQKTGVYEIRLETANSHVVGSPYTVPIELATLSTNLSNNSSGESDEENEEKYIKRKQKIITKIVDFMDEKRSFHNVSFDQKSHKNKYDLEYNLDDNETVDNTNKLLRKDAKQDLNITEDIINQQPRLSESNIFEEKYDAIFENIESKLQESEDKTSCMTTRKYPLILLNKENTLEQDLNIIDKRNQQSRLVEPDILDVKYDAIIENIKSNSQVSKDKTKDSAEEYPSLFLNEKNNIESVQQEISNIKLEDFETIQNRIIYNPMPEKDKEFLDEIIADGREENNNIIDPKLTDKNTDNLSRINYTPIVFTPDILTTSSFQNSPSFNPKLNDVKISNDIETHSVDPTFFEEVYDPTPKLSINSNYEKVFSKNDPTKESILPENSEKNCMVNNLIKVFDATQETSISSHIRNKKIHYKDNSPDLVNCHIEKSKNQIKWLLRKKLKTIGAITDAYDVRQCYLKDCLKQNFEQYIRNKQNKICHYGETEEIFKQNNAKLGIVDKQKQFWNQKLTNNRLNCDRLAKQKTILKDKFDLGISSDVESSELVNFKPLEGIVVNKIQLFENRSTSSSNVNIDKYEQIKKEIQKSKSESFLSTSDINRAYPIQKTVSNEEIIRIPTIQERKTKLLQAYQQNYCSTEKIMVKNTEPDMPTKEADKPQENKNSKSTQSANIVSENNLAPIKTERKHSFRRKARFKQAKLYFHQLEGSDSNLEEFILLKNTSNIEKQLSKSESDSTISHQSFDSVKSLKISERFPVDDLFNDILGDDKRFIGIPNKMAVVASLASLDSDSSRAEYDSEIDTEPDLDNFAERPKRIGRKKVIPGFCGEFPYLPTTDIWRYKSRNGEEINELIPGRVLLARSETDLDIT